MGPHGALVVLDVDAIQCARQRGEAEGRPRDPGGDVGPALAGDVDHHTGDEPVPHRRPAPPRRATAGQGQALRRRCRPRRGWRSRAAATSDTSSRARWAPGAEGPDHGGVALAERVGGVGPGRRMRGPIPQGVAPLGVNLPSVTPRSWRRDDSPWRRSGSAGDAGPAPVPRSLAARSATAPTTRPSGRCRRGGTRRRPRRGRRR